LSSACAHRKRHARFAIRACEQRNEQIGVALREWAISIQQRTSRTRAAATLGGDAQFRQGSHW
jgi:hypothetical protein